MREHEMGKYQPLTDRLTEIEGPEWRANFAELEKVLGFELPKSASQHRAWWGNEASPSAPHKRAWLDSGWRVDQVDLAGGTVVFRRDERSGGAAKPSEAAMTPSEAPAASKPAAASPTAGTLPAVKDPTPPAIQHAVRIYDRRKRAVKIGKFAIGGGVLAAVVATAAGAGAFMLGRFLQRR